MDGTREQGTVLKDYKLVLKTRARGSGVYIKVVVVHPTSSS